MTDRPVLEAVGEVLAPVTGLWGSGDYPLEFISLDDMPATIADMRLRYAGGRGTAVRALLFDMAERKAVRDTLLDIAEDMDARGDVIWTADELAATIEVIDLLGDLRSSMDERIAAVTEFVSIAKPAPAEFVGMKVVADPTMPDGEVSFRIDGKEVGRIVNAGEERNPVATIVAEAQRLDLP